MDLGFSRYGLSIKMPALRSLIRPAVLDATRTASSTNPKNLLLYTTYFLL
jgi:hypothetical protein